MKNFKIEGITIKRQNFGEADKIITVFTKDHGKLQVKAVGIRKITSRRSAHVEMLNHATLTLYRGKIFSILIEAKMIDDYSYLKTDLNKIGLAYHLCELVDKLCPDNQEQSGVFELLKNTLNDFSSDKEMTMLVQEFEIKLLRLLGYWDSQDKTLFTMNTSAFIENIIERKLKSRNIFSKLQ